MYIGHLCGCGHMDIHHEPRAAKATCEVKAGASCGRGCRKDGKAVLRPTFDGKGRQVERVVPPGERIGLGNTVATCGCDACQTLYAQLTGAEQ